MVAAPIPRHVLLFSGHRVDAPGRARPRFPPVMVAKVAARLAAELDALQAGPADLALCQAAAGGDLLFLEACRARGVPCQVMLPNAERRFIDESILPSSDGAAWLERWQALKPTLSHVPKIMPDALGASAPGVDIYERCNRWLLDAALAHGAERLRFLCLWDGQTGDGPGGVGHMVDEVRRRGGEVRWIDPRAL